MPPTNPDYERLRDHLRRPPLEHPVPRQQRTAPVAPRSAGRQVSVVDWILAIGHAVARRLRRAPRSPMVQIHPRK